MARSRSRSCTPWVLPCVLFRLQGFPLEADPNSFFAFPQELASEEQQAANRKIAEENIFKARGAAPQQAETDAFQCGKCKQRRTMYYRSFLSFFPTKCHIAFC